MMIGGDIASTGNMNEDLYNHLQRLNYYKQNPPKSLGVEWVNNSDSFNFKELSRYSN